MNRRWEERRELLGASFALALRNVLQAGLAIVRAKIVAVTLGPTGTGILGQATQLRTFSGRVVNMGFGPGIARYAAEYSGRNDRAALQRLISTVSSVVVLSSLLLILGLVLLLRPISGWVFGDRGLWRFTLLVAVAVPMFVQTDVVGMLLRGTRRFREMAVNGVVISALGILIVVPAVLFFGLDGAIWSIPLAAGAGLIASQLVLYRSVARPLDLRTGPGSVDVPLLARLGRFGVVTSINSTLRSVSDLMVRGSVINTLGSAATGWYQVAWGTALPTMNLAITALAGYGVPTVAALGDDQEAIRRTKDDIMRAYLLVGVPIGTVYVATAQWWIPLLYSNAFLPAVVVARWQMVGQLAWGFRWMMNVGIMAQERFRAALTLSASQSGTFVVLYFVFVGTYGLLAVPIAFFVSQIAVIVPNWWYMASEEGFHPSRRTRRLVWSSVMVAASWVVIPTLADDAVGTALVLGVLLAWSVLNVRRGDVSQLRTLMSRAKRRTNADSDG